MIDGIGRCGTPRLPLTGNDTVTKANDLRGSMALTAAKPQAISQISGIARDLAASPPVDTARVDALRTAIAGGTYRPDPDRIAAAMLRLEAGSRG